MESETTTPKPNCWNCIHVRNVPGSAHKKCGHPTVEQHGGSASAHLRINAALRGIQGGWFMWPYTFDPVWLMACNGFTPKCKRCGKTDQPIKGDVCGSCADDLREEEKAALADPGRAS